jgi:hypothetical protein
VRTIDVGDSHTYLIPVNADSDEDIEIEVKIVSTNVGVSARSRYVAVFSPVTDLAGNVTYSELTDKRVIVPNAQVSVTAAASGTALAVTVANGTYTSTLNVVVCAIRGAIATTIIAPVAPPVVLPGSPDFLWIKEQGLLTTGPAFTSWTDIVGGAVLGFNGAPTADAAGVVLAGAPDDLVTANAGVVALANGNALHWSFIVKLTIVAAQNSTHSVLGWGKTTAGPKSVWFGTYVTSAEQDLLWNGESNNATLTGSVIPTVSVPIFIAARYDGTQVLQFINGAWGTLTNAAVGNQTGVDTFNVGSVNVAGVLKYYMKARYEYIALYNSAKSISDLNSDMAALTELG